MRITIFSEELRECLNAAGLSDCGENDTWNYWYQRLMNAYNESVERQTTTEQAENAKLREVISDAEESARLILGESRALEAENVKLRELCSELLRMAESNDPDFLHWPEIHDELRKLGVKIVKL